MRRHRTIYFNDARHWYLYAFEPPMTMEDAWRPVDDVAGTAIDTFIYGVSSGGLFYPSRVGQRYGVDRRPFDHVAYWRVWHNMQSLIDRGLDPLKVLIDRAHEKGLELIASNRMADFAGLDQKYEIGVPGSQAPGCGPREHLPDFARKETREHKFAVFEELATAYDTDGLELDFAFCPYYFKPDEIEDNTPVMTDLVRRVSEMVRRRSRGPGTVGARVFPGEDMNLFAGLDVRTWIKEGLVDYVMPLIYGYPILDTNVLQDWLVEAAHQSDTAVYGFLQPYVANERTGAPEREFPTPEMMRAFVATYWGRGVDGLYIHHMRWPLGDAEHLILTELGDPELIKEGTKRYMLRRRDEANGWSDIDFALPLSIPSADPGKRYVLHLYIADDIEAASDRIRQVLLRIRVGGLASEDQIAMSLNGRSLSGETCLRDYGLVYDPYRAQWLEFELENVRPHKGDNTLEIVLQKRPERLGGGVTVDEVEVIVEYGSYPSRLNVTES